MGVIENFLENFSAKDLKSRVAGVIVAGLVICAGSAAAMYWLLTSNMEVAVQGMARWSQEEEGMLSVSVDEGDLVKFGRFTELEAVLLDPAEGEVKVGCDIFAIEPRPPAVIISCRGIPQSMQGLERMDARLLLVDQPLWKMLWGRQ